MTTSLAGRYLALNRGSEPPSSADCRGFWKNPDPIFGMTVCCRSKPG